MMKISTLILLALVLGCIDCKDPPVYDYPFHITFDDIYIIANITYRVNGQTFYDPKNNRERVDRTNGQYNAFCGTVLPNVTAPCTLIARQNKRWVIFPTESQCCFCCDSAHGCGILRPDWLNGAEYKGGEKIIDTVYDKWSKDGVVGYNYLWVTQDAATIPRRLNENGNHITDYNVNSWRNQTIPFPESTFALPAYCNADKPTNCPLTSICGEFRTTDAIM